MMHQPKAPATNFKLTERLRNLSDVSFIVILFFAGGFTLGNLVFWGFIPVPAPSDLVTISVLLLSVLSGAVAIYSALYQWSWKAGFSLAVGLAVAWVLILLISTSRLHPLAGGIDGPTLIAGIGFCCSLAILVAALIAPVE